MSGAGLRSGSWVLLDNVASAAIAFGFFVMTARLLPPLEFGIAAIAVSVSQILLPLIDSLFHDALIQRENLDEDDIQAAFSATLLWSLVIAAALVLFAPVIGELTNTPSLSRYLPWLALSALSSGVVAVPSAIARRHMQFRALAMRSVFGRSIAAVIGLALVLADAGIWAVIVQAVLANVLCAIFLVLAIKPSFRLVFAWRRLKPLLRFAGPAMGTQLLLFSSSRVFTLMFSALQGPIAAATWNVALRFVEPLQLVAVTALGQFTLPIYARQQNDTSGMRDLFIIGTRRSSLMLVPMFVGLGACSKPVIAMFAGEQWLPAAPLMSMICLTFAVIASRQLVEITLTSLAMPHLNLLIQATAIALSLVGFAGGTSHGLWGATLGWSLRVLPFVTLAALFMRSRADVCLRKQAAAVAPIFAASGIMTAAVLLVERLLEGYPAPVTLIAAVASGVAVYGAAIFVLDRHIWADLQALRTRRADTSGELAS